MRKGKFILQEKGVSPSPIPRLPYILPLSTLLATSHSSCGLRLLDFVFVTSKWRRLMQDSTAEDPNRASVASERKKWHYLQSFIIYWL